MNIVDQVGVTHADMGASDVAHVYNLETRVVLSVVGFREDGPDI